MKRFVVALAVGVALGMLVSVTPVQAEDYIDYGSGGCYCSGAGGGYDPASYHWALRYNWATGEYHYAYCYDPTRDGYC
jgi:hypothetical protein